MSNVMLGMEGYWMDVKSGMLLSSLVNTEKITLQVPLP